MPDRNAGSLGIVYKKAEELFRKLLAEKDQFYEWVILGTLDLDEYVDEVLTKTKKAKEKKINLIKTENARGA